MPVTFSDLGLFFDITGAILVYFFGIAPQLSRDGTVLLSAGTSNSEKVKAKRYDRLGRGGMFLIFIGFILQWIGDHNTSAVGIRWSVAALAVLLVVAFCCLVFFLRKILKAKIRFVGQYLPQFDANQTGFNQEHLWLFEVGNDTSKVQNLDMCLPRKSTKVDILKIGIGAERLTDVSEVQLGKLGPNSSVTVRVWNLGSGAGSGEDVYLRLGKRVLRPKILSTLDL